MPMRSQRTLSRLGRTGRSVPVAAVFKSPVSNLEATVKKTSNASSSASEKSDTTSASQSNSLSTIFNVRSLSELETSLSKASTNQPTKGINHQRQPKTSNINKSQPQENSISTGIESTISVASSLIQSNEHTWNSSSSVLTEIEVVKQPSSPISLDRNRRLSKFGSTPSDDYHTASEIPSETSGATESDSGEEATYESDFDDSSGDDTNGRSEDADQSSGSRSPDAVSSSSTSRDIVTSKSNTVASKGVTAKRTIRRDVTVQTQTRVSKAVQTDAYPPAFVSVAEYFHSDPFASTSLMPSQTACDGYVALANYRRGVHPESSQNRLIASLLEAHLHCIRTFAEGQKAIYDHWNEILSEHKALDNKRKQRSKTKQ